MGLLMDLHLLRHLHAALALRAKLGTLFVSPPFPAFHLNQGSPKLSPRLQHRDIQMSVFLSMRSTPIFLSR